MSNLSSIVLSNLPSVQTITRWLCESVVVVDEKEAFVLLKYVVLPQLKKDSTCLKDVITFIQVLKKLGFSFNLLSECESILNYQTSS